MDRPRCPAISWSPRNTRIAMTTIGRLSALLCAAGGLAASIVPSARGDGQRDFDFNVGVWQTYVSRLARPLTGSTERLAYARVALLLRVHSERRTRISPC